MAPTKKQEKTAKDFFDLLDSKKLVVYKNSSHFSLDFKNMLDKTKRTGDVFVRLRQVYDPSNFLQFKKNMAIFGLSEDDLMTWIFHYLIEYSLEFIEQIKRFILELLPQGVKIGTRKVPIDFDMTLGTMVVSLKQELNFPDIESMFPYEFRNVLGHSAWWWNNKKFTYYDEHNKIVELSFDQFMGKMFEFDDGFLAIFCEFLSRKP